MHRGRCSPFAFPLAKLADSVRASKVSSFRKPAAKTLATFASAKKPQIFTPPSILLPSASTAYTAVSTVIPSLASQYIAIEVQYGAQSAGVSTVYHTIQGRHGEPLLTTRFHTEQTLSLSCMCRYVGRNRLYYLIAS